MSLRILSLAVGALAAGVIWLGLPTKAEATSYVYVGSWIVGDGPLWTTNPPVYSGQSAAAFLFGGDPADYVTSTIDSDPTHINFLTFLDGWGDDQYLFNPQSDTFSFDQPPPGYNDPAGTATAYSAYILDHSCFNRYSDITQACADYGTQFVNFAFRVEGVAVPEPGALGLFAAGLAGLGMLRRRRRL